MALSSTNTSKMINGKNVLLMVVVYSTKSAIAITPRIILRFIYLTYHLSLLFSLLRVLLADFYAAYLTADGLRQFIDKLHDTRVLVGCRLALDVLL